MSVLVSHTFISIIFLLIGLVHLKFIHVSYKLINVENIVESMNLIWNISYGCSSLVYAMMLYDMYCSQMVQS